MPRPSRSAYQQQFLKDNYDQIHFFKLKESGEFKTNQGMHVFSKRDELFKDKHYHWCYTCPARDLNGIIIPRPFLIRGHKYVRKTPYVMS